MVVEEATQSLSPQAGRRLLEVRDLRVRFRTEDGVVNAVNGVTFDVDEAETLALVGESGSGKSATVLAVMRLIEEPPGKVTGQIIFEGTDLALASSESIRRVRGSRIGIIFQEPLTSLNPVLSIGDQLVEAIRAHEDETVVGARSRSVDLLGMVSVPSPRELMHRYPHQLSGGMCQRVMLAMAISCHPRLLIADEPTTALDITTQAQLLSLVKRLQSELGMAMIWITHDLGVVAGLADRVAVMYAGRIVELAGTDALYDDPLHPYALGLLESIPNLDRPYEQPLSTIPGAPPDMTTAIRGCPFEPRCGYRLARCRDDDPILSVVYDGHARACWATIDSLRRAPR